MRSFAPPKMTHGRALPKSPVVKSDSIASSAGVIGKAVSAAFAPAQIGVDGYRLKAVARSGTWNRASPQITQVAPFDSCSSVPSAGTVGK